MKASNTRIYFVIFSKKLIGVAKAKAGARLNDHILNDGIFHKEGKFISVEIPFRRFGGSIGFT